jgi:hypothetical protein
MNMKKTMAIGALALVVVAPANAQSVAPNTPTVSFQSSKKGMWQTVLLVSAIVGVVGVVQGDSTLIILGGAGVLLSLYQTNQMGFRPQPFRHGLDLMRSGPVSFGIQPFGTFGLQPGFTTPRPTAYLHASFRF